MKESLIKLVLGLVLAMGTRCALLATEPASSEHHLQQVLLEFVVLEVTGGNSCPIELSGVKSLSNAPDQMQLSGFSHAVKSGPGLESTMAALTQDARVKILQRPRIQTSHDTPATLFVGEVWEGHSRTGPAREPLMIGLTLSATPLIHSNGVITLDLRMKQVTREGNVQTKTGLAPMTSTREAAAKIALRDRETILMTGLVTAARQKPESWLRFPKDLPGITGGGKHSVKRSTPKQILLLVRPTLLQQQ